MMLFMTSETFTQPPPAQPPCTPDCFEDLWTKATLTVPLVIKTCNGCKMEIEYWYRHAECIDSTKYPPEVDDYDFQITHINLSPDCNNCVDDTINLLTLYTWANDRLMKHLFVNVWNFPNGCDTTWREAIVSCWTKWWQYFPFGESPPQDSFLVINPCPINDLKCCFKMIKVCYDRDSKLFSREYQGTPRHEFHSPYPACWLNTNGYDCKFACDTTQEPPFFSLVDSIWFYFRTSDAVHIIDKEIKLIHKLGNINIKLNPKMLGNLKLDIFDLNGRLIYTTNKYTKYFKEIILPDLTTGSYFYKIQNEDNLIQSDFFLVE